MRKAYVFGKGHTLACDLVRAQNDACSRGAVKKIGKEASEKKNHFVRRDLLPR